MGRCRWPAVVPGTTAPLLDRARLARLMRRLGAVVGLLFLWPATAAAQGEPHWRLSEAVTADTGWVFFLADGRAVACPKSDAPCDIVDPLTGERRPTTVPRERWNGPIPLDSGKVLTREPALIDPDTGAMEPLDAPLDLRGLSAVAVSGGRAIFTGPAGGLRCNELLVFDGATRTFRKRTVDADGSCVWKVTDLGRGRAMIVGERRSARKGESRMALRILDLETGRWVLSMAFAQQDIRSAFAYGNRALLFTRGQAPDRTERNEAWLLGPKVEARRIAFPEHREFSAAVRLSERQFVLFEPYGAVLWDVVRGVVRVTSNPYALKPGVAQVARRGDAVVAYQSFFEDVAHLFVLSFDGTRPKTPCDAAMEHVRTVLASEHPDQDFIQSHLLALSGGSFGRGPCQDWLEQQGRLPPELQVHLDALAQRTGPGATDVEEVAAWTLCSLAPVWGERLIAQLDRRGVLRPGWSRDLCHAAAGFVPVLAAARGGHASRALARYGLEKSPGGAQVNPWVAPLFDAREDLRRYAGPLLTDAEDAKASGYDELHRAACAPPIPDGVAEACDETSSQRERGWLRAREHPRLLRNLGITTAVVGGIGALAYATRNDEAGRVIALSTGIVGGTVGSFALVVMSARGDWGALLIALPVSLLGGVAGGVASYYASRKPGFPRFATAAVPLSLTLLIGTGVTISDW